MRRRYPVFLALVVVPLILAGCFQKGSVVPEVPGITYSYNIPPSNASPMYVDSDRQLTDGVYGPEFTEGGVGPHLSGLWVGSDADIWIITFDLKKVQRISEVNANFLRFGGAAIRIPHQVDVAVSKNGADWTDVGSQNFDNSALPNGATTAVFADLDTDARYVRVTIEKNNQWIFVDEIEIVF